ncbi:MAG: hypothetical protein WKF97_20080 [Chitinophagaceae bacterium]
MKRQAIIDQTIQIINQLPQDKAVEISDFAAFVLKRYEEQTIIENIQQIVSDSNAFSFLAEEEDLYSINDLKERFNER